MKIYLDEAKKCFQCKNAQCTKYCPIATPIPEIIRLYINEEYDRAAKMLFENNPLSAICGVVCAHDEQCAGHCIRGIKSEPVHFHEIEATLSARYLKQLHLEKKDVKKQHVAIIGAGPAGMSAAMILAREGYQVTIFDNNDQLGGMLRYGIPDFRFDKSLITRFEELLLSLGVKFRYNTLIGPVLTLDHLLEDAYDAIFIGTGVWNPKPLGIKGETLGHLHYAINYLKSPEAFHLGDKVIVIGAGNVAMDAARTAKRNGAKDVRIVYRKDYSFMPATKKEIHEAMEDGIVFDYYYAPKEIVDGGAIFVESRKIEKEDGRVDFQLIEEHQTFMEADSILVAISQSPKTNLSASSDLQTNRWGLIEVNEQGQTNKPGVFACGDVVTGAKTVVEAIAQAKVVTTAIMDYLSSK